MQILIIDNNIQPECWGASDLRRYAKFFPGATFYVRRGPHDDLPKNPSRFDRIIISGSKTSILEKGEWISNLDEFIRRSIDRGKPTLGICYGHQALARSIGGDDYVSRAAHPELGWTKIQILEDSILLKGLPPAFYSFSSHFDEVKKLPPGMKRLAYSEFCSIQACQLENRPVFGIQFHPEKNLSEAEKSLANHKKKKPASQLLYPNQGRQLYNPEIGDIIFKNFLNHL